MAQRNANGNSRGLERENNLRQKLKARFKKETSLNLLSVNIEDVLLKAESKAMEASKTGEPTDGDYWSVVKHAYEVHLKNKELGHPFKPKGSTLFTDSDSSRPLL